MLSRDNLHNYQKEAVQFIKDKKMWLIMSDVLLGKTTSTLTDVSDMLDGFIAEKVLVVAALRVANSVWKQESEKWQHLKHLKVSVSTSTEKQRIAAQFQTADVYVIN